MKSSRDSRAQQLTSCNEAALPSLKKDLVNSILLLRQCGANGLSLFEHLSNVIVKVIDERPPNVVDYFELFSERVRLESSFQMNENHLEDAYKEPDRLVHAKDLLPRLIEKSKRPLSEDDADSEKALSMSEKDDEVIYYEPPARDLWELQFYWNLLGIGFAREEVSTLARALARFNTNPTLASCRFWGKLLGLNGDYYVIESTLTPSELEYRIDALEKVVNIHSLESASLQTNANAEVESNDDKDKANGSDLRAEVNEYPAGWNSSRVLPESQYRPPVEIPAEVPGRGVNRHVYFVCRDLSKDDWIELPPASPHQINISRRIRKFLTGNLDASIISYPPFPGTERNYLRALIARISSSTNISPRSFHKVGSCSDEAVGEEEGFDDSDDDDDDAAAAWLNNDKPITVNEAYRPWSIGKLLKLDYWEHHKPAILKQGRVSIFDGSLLSGNADDEDGEGEGSGTEADVTNKETTPEIPLPLFAACSGDRLTNEGMSTWTIRLSDVVETLVSVQSHVWPGAFAFVKDRTCDNIYIGFGHKFSSIKHCGPSVMPALAAEFPLAGYHEDDIAADDEDEVDGNQ